MNQKINTMKDSQLIDMFVVESNHEALSILVNRHKNTLYTSIKIITKEKELSEDIFQETWIKIINSLKSGDYTDKNKFISWAMRIAHNLCVDHFRKIKNKPVIKTITYHGTDIVDLINFQEPGVDSKIIKGEIFDKLRDMVDILPEDQREVLILRHYADLKFRDIAHILNCSVNTALGRMRYALINLRKIIEEQHVAL